MQNRIGNEGYGNYFSLFSFVLVLQIILDLGIESYSRKEVAAYPHMVNRYLSGLLPVKVFLGLVYFIICTVVALFFNLSAFEWKLFFLLIANQFMASAILFFRANLGGLQKFKAESVVSVLDRLILVVLIGAILYTSIFSVDISIVWFVLGQTIAYFVTLLVVMILLFRNVSFKGVELNLKRYVPILKGLLPFTFLVLLQSYYIRIDSVFLRTLLDDGKAQAGIYAHAFRFLDYLSNYALLFPLLLLPIFSKSIKEKKDPIPLLLLSSQILILPSVIFLSSIFFYRHEIFDLIYDSHAVISADCFAILTVSFLGMCFSYTYGALLTANHNINLLLKMSFVAAVISTVLNVILIPRHQVIGAAIANCVAQLFTIFAHVILVQKKFKNALNMFRVLKQLSLLLVLITLAWVINQYVENIVQGVFLINVLGIGLLFALGIIRISDIKQLLLKEVHERRK